ncbi:MAG: hypothetical protein FWH46_01275 [Methanimicrococcus sp.]|nr:hypothetical protein [Methanimicrococcus sp.]
MNKKAKRGIAIKYPFTLPEFPDSKFEYERGAWNYQLYKDEVILTPSKKEKGRPYILNSDNGEEIKIFLKPQLLGYDPVPIVEVNGNVTLIAEKLPWYKYAIAFIPILLLTGGLIGGFIGGVAILFNSKIIRDGSSPLVQYIKMIFVSGLAFVLTFLAILAFQGALNSID